MTTLRVKLREDAGDEARSHLVAGLEEVGATVEPLFPNEADPDLAALYTVSVDDDHASQAVSLLARSRAVEFAEQEAGRRLILPEELRRRDA
jgi:hypothetical protein